MTVWIASNKNHFYASEISIITRIRISKSRKSSSDIADWWMAMNKIGSASIDVKLIPKPIEFRSNPLQNMDDEWSDLWLVN